MVLATIAKEISMIETSPYKSVRVINGVMYDIRWFPITPGVSLQVALGIITRLEIKYGRRLYRSEIKKAVGSL